MFMAILSWCHWLQKNPFATSIRQPELLFSLMATLEIGALDAFYCRLPQEPWFHSRSGPIRANTALKTKLLVLILAILRLVRVGWPGRVAFLG